MAVSFPGGVKIKNKHKSYGDALSLTLPPCSEHIFPLVQHTGTAIEPIVKTGDRVTVGQKLADAPDYLAVPVHSSISGRVTDIRETTTPFNEKCMGIVVQNDRQYTHAEKNTDEVSPDIYTTRELLWLIRDAGIVEPDGTPAHVKLNPHKSVRFIIANCAESDTYVTQKRRIISEHTEDIISGLKIAMRILNLKEGYIGIENDMKGCVNHIKKLIRYDNSINLIKLKSKYPQSDETHIIKSVTGHDVPSNSIVIDAGTLYEISRAIYHGESVTSKIISVAGNLIKRPSNFTVPLGIPASFLIKKAGGLLNGDYRLISGGGINGKEIKDIDSPVIKTTSSVLALTKDTAKDSNTSCGTCRVCIGKCPMRINPKLLSNTTDLEKAEDNFILDCSECNLCSYICPKNRNPMQKIIELKKELG